MEVIFPHQGPISPNINKQKYAHRLKTNLSPLIKKFVDNKYVVSSPMISAAAEYSSRSIITLYVMSTFDIALKRCCLVIMLTTSCKTSSFLDTLRENMFPI